MNHSNNKTKILALDYGDKKIGLAISDEKKRLALVYDILKNQGTESALKKIKEICQQEEIEKIVVGLPLSQDSPKQKPDGLNFKDLANQQTRKVLNFVEQLKKEIKLEIILEDERLSSKMADRLKRGLVKGDNDAVAAMVILQNYLDRI